MAAALHFGLEAERLVAQPAFDHFFETNESAAANEKNVCGIDWEEFLMRMFASTLRRNVRDRAFENFQQRLLHAFARNVARNRRVLVLAANLVDFVNVDDALLRAFDVAVGGLQKFENYVFDVFADVAGFSERGGVDDRERHAEHARQRLRQQASCRFRSARSAECLLFEFQRPNGGGPSSMRL